MHRRELPVASPCTRPLADVPRVGEGRRWCSSCEHEVHDLTELDEQRARALLRAHRGRSLCVRYTTDPDGRLRFAPADRLVRRPRLTGFALASMVSLVLIAGCATKDASTQATSTPVVYVDPWAEPEEVTVEPYIDGDIFMGAVVVIEEGTGFLDPLVFELEDEIVPETISKSRR
jgi:hypothetical protein